MSIIIFILILSFLVIIHELGHFLAAKWAKIKVDEFGLGYPPKAIKLFKKWGTEFTINWIPFGGFVRMQGEEGETSDDKKKLTGQFYQANAFQKLVVILSGPAVNFVFGVIAFTIVFTKMGIPEVIPEARVSFIAPNSPAEEAGLPANVNIFKLVIEKNEYIVGSTQEVVDVINDNKGKTASVTTTGNCEGLVCEEGAFEYQIYIRTKEETPVNEGSIGIAFEPVVFVKYPAIEMPFRSMVYGVKQASYLGVQIVQAFSSLLTDIVTKGKMPADIAGPIGIVHQAESSKLFEEGILTVLSFAGMLSINLAVMNVLPLPPLDGGRAVFVILEALFHKKRTQRIEYLLNYGGYIFLLGLIVIITIKDVMRLFGR